MAQWYFSENGAQHGPIDDAELSRLIASQRITPATLLWREGMVDWEPLPQVQTQLASENPLSAPPAPWHPPYPAASYPITSGLAVASLICGLAAWLTCTLVPGIPAVICGHLALSQIANSATPIQGRGMALAGLLTGYLAILPFVVILIVFLSIAVQALWAF